MPPPRLRRSPLDNIPGYAGGTLGDQLRRDPKDEIYEKMQQSILPPPNVPKEENTPPPRINIGSVDKTLNGATDLVRLREDQSSDPNATRPRYAGVARPQDEIGQAKANIEALQKAPPNSEIQTTDNRVGWGAPKPHKGIWNRLGQAGKGLVVSMGEYARTHPDASSTELLSAGGTGAIVGGASPVSIDALQRQAEIGREQKALGSKIDLEQEQAQLEGLKMKPILEAEKIRVENEQREREAKSKSEEFAERQRHNRATENRPRSERQAILRTRKNADGSETTLKSNDNGETWQEINDLTSASQEKPEVNRDELIGNLDKRIGEYQAKAAAAKQAAEDLKAAAVADGVVGSDVDLERARLLEEEKEANKQAAQLRGERDREAAKPQSVRAQSNKPDTRKGTINKGQQQKWLTDNPGKTLEDMKRLYPNARMVE